MKYFFANWKANKSLSEAMEWVTTFKNKIQSDTNLKQTIINHYKIVLCPPYPLIYPIKESLKEFPFIFFGSQDVSSVTNGTFTGETTAYSLTGLIDYTIIGHSERRKMYAEHESLFFEKAKQAHQMKIKVCYCIGSQHDRIPDSLDFIAWEPPESISTGDGKGSFKSIEEIIQFKKQITIVPPCLFFYGGSVNEENIKQYASSEEINGFIIGGASLDALRFLRLIQNS